MRLSDWSSDVCSSDLYAGDQRVVNLVLKRHFVSWEAQASVKAPTAGGQIGGTGSAGRFVIDGKSRGNAQGQLAGEGALQRSLRALTAAPAEDRQQFLPLIPAASQRGEEHEESGEGKR